MGQVIGQSTANAAEPASDPYTTKDLMTTVLHTLFDFGQLRLQSGIPRALTQVFESGRRIQDLF